MYLMYEYICVSDYPKQKKNFYFLINPRLLDRSIAPDAFVSTCLRIAPPSRLQNMNSSCVFLQHHWPC